MTTSVGQSFKISVSLCYPQCSLMFTMQNLVGLSFKLNKGTAMKHIDLVKLQYHRRVNTYEGVEGRIRGHPSHFVDGFEGQDVLIVVGAPQGAAGAAAGAQVTRREGCWSTWMKKTQPQTHTHTQKH